MIEGAKAGRARLDYPQNGHEYSQFKRRRELATPPKAKRHRGTEAPKCKTCGVRHWLADGCATGTAPGSRRATALVPSAMREQWKAGPLPIIPDRGTSVSAAQLQSVEDTIWSMLPQVDDMALLEEWRARARALESYLRDKEMQRPMLGVQRRTEARIGQLLGEGMRGNPIAIGLSKIAEDDRGAFRLLGRALAGECGLTSDEWRKSRRALLKLVRLRLGLMPVTPPLPEGLYSCIVADPPWQLDTGPDVIGGTGEAGHDALDYDQMSLEAIKALGEDLRAHLPDDAHLYLWTTNRYVEAAYGVARAWGFEPSVLLVWAKTPQGVGLGDTFRLTTEFILFARRGNLPDRQIIPTTWFNWPRGRHSEKPDEFFEMVESVSPGSKPTRLEMFARKEREGWTVWGDEVP